jgi:hypothetical protein
MMQTLFEGQIGDTFYAAYDCKFLADVSQEMPLMGAYKGDVQTGVGHVMGRAYCLPRTPFDRPWQFMLALTVKTGHGTRLDAERGFDPWGRPGVCGIVIREQSLVGRAWYASTDEHSEFITLV